jgi:plastocyanin
MTQEHMPDIEGGTTCRGVAGSGRSRRSVDREGWKMIRWRLAFGFGVAVALAVLLVGCAGETASGDVRSGAAGSGAIRVVMNDEVFQPDVLEVPAGTQVTLEITNAGEENHNFTIDDLDTSTGPMHPGDVMTVTFTAPKGTTEFRCTWHSGMVGGIVAT